MLSNSLYCPTRACTGCVEHVGDWEQNRYCDYIRGVCNQCNQKYWHVIRDQKDSLYIRDRGDFFDNRRGSHAAFRVTQKGNSMNDVQVTLTLDDIVDIVVQGTSEAKEPEGLEELEELLNQREEEHLAALKELLSNKMLDVISGLKQVFGDDIAFELDEPFGIGEELTATASINSFNSSGELSFTFDITQEELDQMPTYRAYCEVDEQVEELRSQKVRVGSYELAQRKQKLKEALIAHIASSHSPELLEKAKELFNTL